MSIGDLFSFQRFKRRHRPPHQPGSLDYRTPDGRRHLRRVFYPLPKDAEENQRLNFQHCYLKWLVGRNYLAPLPRTLASILDVGCGSGIWAREMAQQFPGARVVGVDLELPPPVGQAGEQGRVRPLSNVEFRQANLLEGLPFADQTFAYVHQRLLSAGIPADRWQPVVHELARVTRRGGWVELFEYSTTFHRPGPATEILATWQARFDRQRGTPTVDLAPNLQTFLRVAGLQCVSGRCWRAPLGAWGQAPVERRAGGLLAADVLAVLRAMQGWCWQVLEIPPAEFAAVVEALPSEWATFKTEFTWYGAVGQVV